MIQLADGVGCVLISSPLFNQNEPAQAIDAQPGGQL
jgi:hypothetical protein